MTESDASEQARIRHLRRAMNEADRLSEKLDLSRGVRETATMLYRRLRKEGLLPGRGVEEVVAAAIHLGCKMENIPRTADEIAEHSNYDRVDILRSSKYLNEALDLEVGPSDPKPYATRYCAELDLREETEEKAKELVSLAIDEGLTAGRAPSAIAAGAVYGASQFTKDSDLTQEEIGDVAEVSTVTIRNRYQEQIEAYNNA